MTIEFFIIGACETALYLAAFAVCTRYEQRKHRRSQMPPECTAIPPVSLPLTANRITCRKMNTTFEIVTNQSSSFTMAELSDVTNKGVRFFSILSIHVRKFYFGANIELLSAKASRKPNTSSEHSLSKLYRWFSKHLKSSVAE